MTKGKLLVDLHKSDSNLNEAIGIAKSAKAKLQKDAKKPKLPKEISTKYDAALKRVEKVLEDAPKDVMSAAYGGLMKNPYK
jgi:molecular chaperone DnaK (HSP70)